MVLCSGTHILVFPCPPRDYYGTFFWRWSFSVRLVTSVPAVGNDCLLQKFFQRLDWPVRITHVVKLLQASTVKSGSRQPQATPLSCCCISMTLNSAFGQTMLAGDESLQALFLFTGKIDRPRYLNAEDELKFHALHTAFVGTHEYPRDDVAARSSASTKATATPEN